MCFVFAANNRSDSVHTSFFLCGVEFYFCSFCLLFHHPGCLEGRKGGENEGSWFIFLHMSTILLTLYILTDRNVSHIRFYVMLEPRIPNLRQHVKKYPQVQCRVHRHSKDKMRNGSVNFSLGTSRFACNLDPHQNRMCCIYILHPPPNNTV